VRAFGSSVVRACALLAALVCTGNAGPAGTSSPGPRIVRLDPRFDRLVPAGAVIEKLADGFEWVEGPVWDRRTGSLLFSDVPRNRIHRWKPGEAVSVFLEPSGYTGKTPFAGREPGSNGLAFDAEGRLVFCQHGDRAIARLESDGRRTIVADRFGGKRINSPNDVTLASTGDVYFTDPPFGLPGHFDDPGRELSFCGVYRVSRDGAVALLTDGVRAPNGIDLSADERTLYVSDSATTRWYTFALGEDGALGPARLLYDGARLKEGNPGVADGLKVDVEGNVFGAAPGGIVVIAPDGTLLGRLDFGVPTGNCAWGEDGRTLFIASNTAIYRVRLDTKGAGF